MYHNPLHTSEFPSTRQMESEIIRITCDLFNNPGYAVITTGGSQSIALAVLAHRNYYRDTKGIKKPNIVMPRTAHVAFNKACHYFQIQVRSIEVDPVTLTVSARNIAKHIDGNTILLVGSAPNFPYGNCENIPEYAALAK